MWGKVTKMRMEKTRKRMKKKRKGDEEDEERTGVRKVYGDVVK